MEFKIEIIKASCKGDKVGSTPNQDYLGVFESNNLFIVTVSDGLGSSKFSLEGAAVACNTVIEEINRFNFLKDISALNSSIPEAWKRKIADKPGNIKDYRTANSFVVVMKKENKIIVGQLGDVFVSVLTDGLSREINSKEKDFLNETDCLGSGGEDGYCISTLEFYDSFNFLIATDGIGDELLLDKIESLHGYLLTKYNKIDSSKRNSILKKEIIQNFIKKNNDDKTLVFGWSKQI
jgi:hypothetical protein